jgi:hypothetical protein
MNRQITTFVLILSSGFCAYGFAAEPKCEGDDYPAIHQDATTDVGPILEKLDVNKDGFVDKTEAGQLRGLSEMFDFADADKDARVDPAELSKFLKPAT